MNQVEVASRSFSSASFLGYQRILLGVFGKMRLGRLCLELPGGEVVRFGADSATDDDCAATIQVRSPRFFKRCVLFGDIGFGESYAAGEWDTSNITRVIEWMVLNRASNPGVSGSSTSNFMIGMLRGLNKVQHLLRDNDLKGSVRNISAHYDLGNDFFKAFLDESMMYSSADFESGAITLEQAQRAKLQRLADAVQVKPGDHVLEIGSGWGAFAIYLAQERGCRVTTVTVSRRQHEAVQAKIRETGLSDRVEVRFQDYRKIKGQFDKIVSVEMVEAVGHKHLPDFFAVAEKCLKQDGLFGVQVITCADHRYDLLRRDVDWTQKHIFPGSLIPSLGALTDAARETSSFQMHSLHDLGKSYARTLAEWRNRFNANLDCIRSLGFDEQFVRAWNYYFSYCEAAFDTRHISVKQIVFTRPNNSELS